MNEQSTLKEKFKKEMQGTKKNVFELLRDNPDLRNSDKKLIWAYWDKVDDIIRGVGIHGLNSYIFKGDFLINATHPETIRRTAQKIREEYPELCGEYFIRRGRKVKEEVTKEELGYG